jgi:hypothetical protein
MFFLFTDQALVRARICCCKGVLAFRFGDVHAQTVRCKKSRISPNQNKQNKPGCRSQLRNFKPKQNHKKNSEGIVIRNSKQIDLTLQLDVGQQVGE